MTESELQYQEKRKVKNEPSNILFIVVDGMRKANQNNVRKRFFHWIPKYLASG